MNTNYDEVAVNLRTAIRIQQKHSHRESGKLDAACEWVDLGNQTADDPPRWKRCHWINAHGAEVLKDNMAVGRKRATLTIRYDERVNATCRVLLGSEAWEIVSVDDVRMGHRWMELIVERTVGA